MKHYNTPNLLGAVCGTAAWVINPLGEVIHFKQYGGSETQVTTRFDAPSGIYFLEVSGMGAEKATKAIIAGKR
jgi:hypothetical protein